MRFNPISCILLIGLATLGGWGLWKISLNNTTKSTELNSNTQKAALERRHTPLAANTPTATSKQTDKYFNDDLDRVKKLLQRNDYNGAVEYVNGRYSELNTTQLNLFKTLFINTGLVLSDDGQLKKAQRLYIASASLFEGVEVLDLLSNISVELNDWQTALDALLKSSLLEYRPEAISRKLNNLVNVASQLKNHFLASSDSESVRQLYQSLYEAHPSYAQFQLELAFSHLALGNNSEAKQLFSIIQYDLEVGNIAQNQLALLEEQTQETIKQPEQPKKVNNDIRISLLRAGNSFLVDTSIDGRKTRLLLDTGASITALSKDLISHLRLSPTGEVVRLSTANGVTESPLFLAKKITLGRITIRDLVVAEINLGSSQQFQGLLGTDLLNKVGTKYSYLIDNENNTLIFRSKSR